MQLFVDSWGGGLQRSHIMAVAALAACRYLSTIVSKVKFRNRPLIPRSPRSTSCSQPGQGKVVVLGVNELRFQPGLLILSILSMLGEGSRIRGLLWLELSDPTSLNESSSISKSSFTHLWQILCWQGRISGWVNSSLHAGQMSSLSIFLMVTLNWKKEISIKGF